MRLFNVDAFFYFVLFHLSAYSVKAQQVAHYSNASALSINPYIKDYSQLPIKPARTLSFVTDEATNVEVDVSPDGKTLVFTILGELFTLPVAGGNAVQISRGMAVNSCPVWSPDGNYIAFISDATGNANIHIRNLSGKFHKVLDPDRHGNLNFTWNPFWWPRWLPESNALLVDTNVYFLSGQKYPLPESMVACNDWQKNNNCVIGFTSNKKFLFTAEYTDLNWTVLRIDRQTGETVKIHEADGIWGNSAINPSVSNDGNQLVYQGFSKNDSDSLFCIDLQTKRRKLLALMPNSLRNTRIEYDRKQHYAFSPDCQNLFIGYGGKLHCIEIATGNNRIIPFSAKVELDMGELVKYNYPINYAQRSLKNTQGAYKSDDKKHLVFTASGMIYIMDLITGKARRLADGPGILYDPIFSPDGKRVAYSSEQKNYEGAIYLMPIEGGGPRLISKKSDTRYASLFWSPDGQYIAAIKTAFPFPEIRSHGMNEPDKLELISVADGKTRILIDSLIPNNKATISFTADGKRLNYTSLFSYNTILLTSVNLDGKDKRLEASFQFKPNTLVTIGSARISPDGQYLVYRHRMGLFLAPLSRLGAPAEILSPEKLQPAIQFFNGGIDPHWEKGGKILSWSFGNKYYSIAPEKILKAAQNAKVLPGRNYAELMDIVDVKVQPDEIIDLKVLYPNYYGRGSIALRNARIITMSDTEVIEKGTILITNGRIVAVDTSSKITIPAGYVVYDLNGRTIMPGMVDLHAHVERGEVGLFAPELIRLSTYLAYGVTTIRDPSSSLEMFGRQEMIQKGLLIGPRFYSVGPTVGSGSGYPIGSLMQAQEEVRKRAALGAISIKQYEQRTRLQQQWVLLACKKYGMNMTNEINYYYPALIGQIKNGSPQIEHFAFSAYPIYNDFRYLMAACETTFTATIRINTAGLQYFRANFPEHTIKMKNIDLPRYLKPYTDTVGFTDIKNTAGLLELSRLCADLRHHGSRISMGSHGNDEGIGAHEEVWAMQMGGLTNLEALQAATIIGAEALGIQKDLGSLSVGKIPDLIVLYKNPLDDIRNTNTIQFVMKDGILYDADNLKQIWPYSGRGVSK